MNKMPKFIKENNILVRYKNQKNLYHKKFWLNITRKILKIWLLNISSLRRLIQLICRYLQNGIIRKC